MPFVNQNFVEPFFGDVLITENNNQAYLIRHVPLDLLCAGQAIWPDNRKSI